MSQLKFESSPWPKMLALIDSLKMRVNGYIIIMLTQAMCPMNEWNPNFEQWMDSHE